MYLYVDDACENESDELCFCIISKTNFTEDELFFGLQTGLDLSDYSQNQNDNEYDLFYNMLNDWINVSNESQNPKETFNLLMEELNAGLKKITFISRIYKVESDRLKKSNTYGSYILV